MIYHINSCKIYFYFDFVLNHLKSIKNNNTETKIKYMKKSIEKHPPTIY